MKKKSQKVYIKGYVGRGKEVLAFLEGNGGVNSMHFTGEVNGLLYIDEQGVIRLVTIYSDIDKYEDIVRSYKRVFLPTVDTGYVVVRQEDIYPTAELATFHLHHNVKYKKGEFIVKKLEQAKK